MPLSALLLLPAALAYESDQLMVRLNPPADITAAANAEVDRRLALAVQLTNQRTRCEGTDSQVRHALARSIREQMGDREEVPARGLQPVFHYGAYAAWLETGPVDRRSFPARDDLYSDVLRRENFIVSSVGPSSTVQLAGQLVGIDKIDHFWVQGHMYFKRSNDGVNAARAVRWGTRTERLIWGLATTEIFSYADLAANYGGYQFYAGLLGPDSALTRDDSGCVVQGRGFDWAEWIDEDYDEVLNPPFYARDVQLGVEAFLDANLDSVCAAYMAWGPANRELDKPQPYAADNAPPRSDPFALEARCDGSYEAEASISARTEKRRTRREG